MGGGAASGARRAPNWSPLPQNVYDTFPYLFFVNPSQSRMLPGCGLLEIKVQLNRNNFSWRQKSHENQCPPSEALDTPICIHKALCVPVCVLRFCLSPEDKHMLHGTGRDNNLSHTVGETNIYTEGQTF